MLSLQIKSTIGNQNFDTFDTLNIFVFKGDGAAGMDATFDTLMARSLDEPGFRLRPPRKRGAGVGRQAHLSIPASSRSALPRRIAGDGPGRGLLADDPEDKGHPTFRAVLAELAAGEAEGDDVAVVRFAPERGRDAHLTSSDCRSSRKPIGAAATSKLRRSRRRSVRDPTRSPASSRAATIEFERVADYWGQGLAGAGRPANFDRLRYEYFRDRQVGLRGVQVGRLQLPGGVHSRNWATGYDFPAMRDGRVKRETLPQRRAGSARRAGTSTRGASRSRTARIREAIGLAFDFEWTNQNIMFGLYKRTDSFFENSHMKASGKPGPEELALLEPFRGKVPDEVFGEPYVPPASDGSGADRDAAARADDLLRAAGCKRDGATLKLPGRASRSRSSSSTSSRSSQPHTQPFQAEPAAGSASGAVPASSMPRNTAGAWTSTISTSSSMALGGSMTPGDDLRIRVRLEAGQAPGSRNIAGVADPAVDALIDGSRKREVAGRTERRLPRARPVLRAGRYWIPMWYRHKSWVAYWDVFSRPDDAPQVRVPARPAPGGDGRREGESESSSIGTRAATS